VVQIYPRALGFLSFASYDSHGYGGSILSRPHTGLTSLEVNFTSDSQSASLSWCQAPTWDPRQIFFLLEIVFRQLRVCYFVEPSLTIGRHSAVTSQYAKHMMSDARFNGTLH
jgi:hypothetical protein